MGRQSKEGLEYFSVDVDMFEDHKILLAQELIDPDGTNSPYRLLIPYIAIRLLREIYKNGYFMEWNDLQSLTLSSKIGGGITMTTLNNFTSCLVKSGFFSQEIYNKFHILTSNGIQKRWCFVAKNLNRKNFSILAQYKLYTFEKSNPMRKSAFPPEEIAKSTEEMVQNGQESATTSVSFSFSSNDSFKKEYLETNSEEKKEKKKSTEEMPKSTEEMPKSTEEMPKSTEEMPKSTEEMPKSTEEMPKSTEEIKDAIKLDKIDLQVLANSSDEFREEWRKWVNYLFSEHGKVLKSVQHKTAAVEELCRIADYDEQTAIRIIKKSMSAGWKTFFRIEAIDNHRVESKNSSKNEKISVMSGNAPLQDQQAHYTRRKRD